MDEEGAGRASAAVALARGLTWINECFPVGPSEHEHVSVYLLAGDGGSVVVDSGSFYHRDSIRDRLQEATEGSGPDAIVLSHSDYPHAGNISAFREAWGDIDIVASSGTPDIQGLPYATPCPVGGSLEVCGRRMSFVDPPLADRSHTTWIFDHPSGALFTSDGFGNFHRPGECGRLYGDFEDGIPVDDVYRFHRETLSWLRWVDPPRLRERLEEIVDAHDPSWICPVHGNAIEGADVPAYLARLDESIRRIAAENPLAAG